MPIEDTISQSAGRNQSDSSEPIGALREGAPKRGPKLLFLAYGFPPCNASSAVRTWNIAKYLARRGWEVTVVTPHPSVWRQAGSDAEFRAILEQEGVRRIETGFAWRCLSPGLNSFAAAGIGRLIGRAFRRVAWNLSIENEIGWIGEAAKACDGLTPEDVDVILASGPPFVAFRLAKRLADRLGRPYVLDYRDPWTGNPHRDRPDRASIVAEEERLLRDCAGVTIVSDCLAAALDERFRLGSKLHVITNGYDPEHLDKVEPYPFGHFAIVYTGIFYPPKRVITPVMAALQRLKATGSTAGAEWRFHFYGSEEQHVCEAAQRFGVQDRVVCHGHVPRKEALSAVRGAGITVVITSVEATSALVDRGIVPGKVFEALGLGTPTLLIAPPDSDVGAIMETSEAARRFTGSDVEGMASFIADAICGRLPRPKKPDMYAWTNLASAMDSVLRCAIRPN